MITVKDFSVKITYRVELGNVDMPEGVYEQLSEAYDNGDEIDQSGLEYAAAAEWLSNNIREGDCMDWEAEIEELS
jgi:hypothetical protein